jgi:hypothetical protein
LGVHLHVSEVELAALNAAAERRSLKVGGFVAKLVETGVRDNLLDAVLEPDGLHQMRDDWRRCAAGLGTARQQAVERNAGGSL